MVLILDGKKLASEIESDLATEVKELISKYHRSPILAVVLVGEDPASKIYVASKTKRANACGIQVFDFKFPENITTQVLKNEIKKIVSGASEIMSTVPDGVLIQLPLPKKIDVDEIFSIIPAEIDVDCLAPISQGYLFRGKQKILPCTPSGIIKLIESAAQGGENLFEGKKAVVIGRSLIVGKPLGLMLLDKNCAVTYCHSKIKTPKLRKECRSADILISAIGKPKKITDKFVKKGAIIIDVGINRQDDGILVGDVDFEKVKDIASAITPVPGGVGPMTIAMLLTNVVNAYKINVINSLSNEFK